jgi:hypothetical protein
MLTLILLSIIAFLVYSVWAFVVPFFTKFLSYAIVVIVGIFLSLLVIPLVMSLKSRFFPHLSHYAVDKVVDYLKPDNKDKKRDTE